MTYSGHANFSRPFVFATGLDLRRLQAIALSDDVPGSGGDLLLQELARMAVIDASTAAHFVRLGSQVTYTDLRTRRVRTVRVVTPDDVEQDDNRISVTSSIGAALIGLAEGSIFRWRASDGTTRAIKVLRVEI